MIDIGAIVSNGVRQAEAAPPSQVAAEYLSPAELWAQSKVDLEHPPEADPVVIWIKGQAENIEFGTLGNFSLLTGRAKVKKSFLVGLLVAAALKNRELQEKIVCDFPANKRRIIYIDTEQGKYRVFKAFERVCCIAEANKPDNIEVVNLRPYDPNTRASMIDWALTEGNPNNDIGLVVIDGIRDLIHDINDPKEATAIATKLMQWSERTGCHIVTVLHQNKTGNEARGHVGTELVNKAETVVSVAKYEQDPAVSIVKAEQCRGRELPQFAFLIDVNGLPVIALNGGELDGSNSTAKKRSFDPYQFPPEAHFEVLARVFTGAELTYKELQSRLIVEWAANDQKVSGNAAQLLITYYQNKMGWIVHNGKQGKAAKYTHQPH